MKPHHKQGYGNGVGILKQLAKIFQVVSESEEWSKRGKP
jgi:hypothetical protein